MSERNPKQAIKAWAEDDRPREKMLLKGRSVLSDAELIAILIGSGSRDESAVELAQRILASVEDNIDQLAKLNLSELQKFKGIGEAKAISIAAALELGRRRKENPAKEKIKINSSSTAYAEMAPHLEDLPYEEFWMACLNRANKVIAKQMLSRGGLASTVVDVKVLLKIAIDKMASGILLCHNHPSGNLQPSEADLKLTKNIKAALVYFDIQLIDHLIIGERSYYSFADNNIL